MHDALSHSERPPVDGTSPLSPQQFAQLRSALIRALRVSPEAREPLCDALEIVEAMQQQADASGTPPPQVVRPARSRAKVQQYGIEATPEGQFLVETRPGESQPFRCPRAIYDAAAKVLAESADALHFDELSERLSARVGQRQPDYRLRVPLRFWTHQRLVARFRTRYKAVERDRFVDLAREAWETLGGLAARSRVA